MLYLKHTDSKTNMIWKYIQHALKPSASERTAVRKQHITLHRPTNRGKRDVMASIENQCVDQSSGGHGWPRDTAGVWQVHGWKPDRLWPVSHPADARSAEPARQVRDANWQRVYSVTDAELSAWGRAWAVVHEMLLLK